MGWRVLAFTQNLGNLQCYIYTVSCKNVVQGLVFGDITFIHWGSLKSDRQTRQLYSQVSDMPFTDIYKINTC